MKLPHSDGSAHPQPGAGDPTWRPSMGYLYVLLGIVVIGIAYALLSAPSPTPVAQGPATRQSDNSAAKHFGLSLIDPEDARSFAANSASQKETEAQAAQQRAREVDNDPTPDLSSYIPRGAKPTMNEVIKRLHEAGVYTGLAAFNPPGTRPNLVGLAVAEDFPLPKGYVRHHQSTDDGQKVEAILMFAPDFQMLDAAGKPVAMPDDRIVPPELAPPGLPIRHIVIPAPLDPEGSKL
jgi:hypothetical protein